MSRLVGLTGGIATGKSTVARMFADRGAAVVDADQGARVVVEPGQPALAQLVEAFGEEILDEDGRLDRGAMRQRITADPDAKRTLESITHPAIRAWVMEQIAHHVARGAPVVIVEAALLVETGTYKMYPTLIVVSCSSDTQLERLMARDGVDRAAARGFIATQLPLANKEAAANHVIRNDGDLQALETRVDEVWSAIRP